jgi:8-oxo-dGTP pyrophosphatase MutT (NUDIX family)
MACCRVVLFSSLPFFFVCFLWEMQKRRENFQRFVETTDLNTVFTGICERLPAERPTDPFDFAADVLRQHAAQTVERSAGVVVVRDGRDVLLVNEPGGSWGPPKGHLEGCEAEIDAALRELHEETGIARTALRLVAGFRRVVEYVPRRHPQKLKRITLFAAHLDTAGWDGKVVLEPKLRGFRWVAFDDAVAEECGVAAVTYAPVR